VVVVQEVAVQVAQVVQELLSLVTQALHKKPMAEL
jgi:hypothetical protein